MTIYFQCLCDPLGDYVSTCLVGSSVSAGQCLSVYFSSKFHVSKDPPAMILLHITSSIKWIILSAFQGLPTAGHHRFLWLASLRVCSSPTSPRSNLGFLCVCSLQFHSHVLLMIIAWRQFIATFGRTLILAVSISLWFYQHLIIAVSISLWCYQNLILHRS